MDLGVTSNIGSSGVRKQSFQLKPSRKDGLILQIHHTVPTANNEIYRVRFIHTSFDHTGEQLATADHRGNIFIIDLSCHKFWMLPNLDSPCSVIGFTPFKKNEILVGLNDCAVHFVNTELGLLTGKLIGHVQPPTQISFSSDHQYCLSASADEAIIWDLKSNTQVHRLSMNSGVAVKKVVFMPVSNNILACFQDDTMHVWKFETFECLKQIIPEAWKSHHLKSLTFTKDGRAMVIGGHTSSLVVFCLDNWTVKKVIELPSGIAGVKHIEFLPQMFDGGANKILGLLPGNKCSLHFLDIETSEFLSVAIEPECTITKFACSSNGKFITCILNSGEVNVYNSAKIFERKHRTESTHSVPKVDDIKLQTVHKDPAKQSEASKFRTTSTRRHTSQHHLTHVQNQIKETLDLPRLKQVLKEFGEYPESYRALIWKTVLQLPYNQQSFVGLVNRDCHPAYVHLEEKFPLENKTVLKNLKRLLSSLANWCGLFAEVKYLPLFVFPFVKVFQNDPFVCFEVVTTIIVNWCQHWFEYFPYPPVNVLAMIENVLADHDPALLEHLFAVGVTSRLYAWTLLENAMSEVLNPSEWLRLWDHVVSNEPTFLLMAVVAYNVTCRGALMACHTLDDFEYFYHNQNAIDMKRLISNSYRLCRNTKNSIHPRQYINDFTPLEKGVYPIYNQYPKYIVDYQAQQMNVIRSEEAKILKEEQLALDLKIAQEKRIREELQTDVQADRIQKMEAMYRAELLKEEDRVADRRRKVLTLRQELRSREVDLLDMARDRLQKQNLLQRGLTLDRLVDDIKRKKVREDTELMATEEEMRRHYAELLTHKHELEQQLGTVHSGDPVVVEQQALHHKQEQLANELQRLREEASSENHSRQISIASRVAKVGEMMQRVEMELAREMAQRQQNIRSGQTNLKTIQLQSQTNELEMEVESLLQQLTDSRLRDQRKKTRQEDLQQAQHKTLQNPPDYDCMKRSQTAADRLYPLPSHQTQRADECKCRPKCQQRCNSLHDQWTGQQNKRSMCSDNEQDIDYKIHSGTTSHRQMSFEAQPSTSAVQTELSARGSEYYSRERRAVQAAMNVREQIVNGERHILKENNRI